VPLILLAPLVVAALILIEYYRRSASAERRRSRELRRRLSSLGNEVESMERFRTDLLVRVGTEIRGPLSSIRNRAEALAQPFMTEEEIRADTDAMRRDLELLDHYLDSLGEILELHSLESSSDTPPLMERGEVVSLDGILARSLSSLDSEISGKGLSLAVASDEGLMVRGDPEYLSRALVELVSQAVMHAPHGSVLHLHLSDTEEGRVKLRLGYTGEPLVEATSSALLIALARQIISAHGGSLTSLENPGQYSLELDSAEEDVGVEVTTQPEKEAEEIT
jgi:signal transduction histidine kinase